MEERSEGEERWSRYLDDCHHDDRDYFDDLDDQKVERGEVIRMIIRLLVMIIMAIPTTVVMIIIVMIIITKFTIIMMIMMMSRVGEERTLVLNLLTVLEGPEVSFPLIIILIW